MAKTLNDRVGLAATVKDSLRSVMERTGFSLVRTCPVQRVKPVHVTADELAALDRDLAQIGLNPRDFPYFPSPQAVRGYLTPERINFLHQLLETTRSLGVDLKGRRVLEVGVGSGYLQRLLTAEVGDGSVHGCDFYEELTRLARGVAPGANVFQASIEDLKSSTETYDVVFCTEVIEHILDTETPIPTLVGLVRDGGAVVVTVPNCARDFTPSMGSEDGTSFVGHVNFWSKESWGFYISRLAPPHRYVTGELGIKYADDSLYAVIFKD